LTLIAASVTFPRYRQIIGESRLTVVLNLRTDEPGPPGRFTQNLNQKKETVMSRSTSLIDIIKGKTYQISGFTNHPNDYTDKLHKMGFVDGTPIELAPVAISDPMVFQIRGSRIALRKKEAQQILVREL
jgi:ferrous iron transport protein A